MPTRIEQAFTTSAAVVNIDTNQGNRDLSGNGDQDRAVGGTLRIYTDADVYIKFNDNKNDTITGATDTEAEFFPADVIEKREMTAPPKFAHGITASGTANVDFSWQ